MWKIMEKWIEFASDLYRSGHPMCYMLACRGNKWIDVNLIHILTFHSVHLHVVSKIKLIYIFFQSRCNLTKRCHIQWWPWCTNNVTSRLVWRQLRPYFVIKPVLRAVRKYGTMLKIENKRYRNFKKKTLYWDIEPNNRKFITQQYNLTFRHSGVCFFKWIILFLHVYLVSVNGLLYVCHLAYGWRFIRYLHIIAFNYFIFTRTCV